MSAFLPLGECQAPRVLPLSSQLPRPFCTSTFSFGASLIVDSHLGLSFVPTSMIASKLLPRESVETESLAKKRLSKDIEQFLAQLVEKIKQVQAQHSKDLVEQIQARCYLVKCWQEIESRFKSLVAELKVNEGER